MTIIDLNRVDKYNRIEILVDCVKVGEMQLHDPIKYHNFSKAIANSLGSIDNIPYIRNVIIIHDMIFVSKYNNIYMIAYGQATKILFTSDHNKHKFLNLLCNVNDTHKLSDTRLMFVKNIVKDMK